MSTTPLLPVREVEDLSAAQTLAAAAGNRALLDAAGARELLIAAHWADLHPPESIPEAACFHVPGSEEGEPVAGEGCPLVAEFCLADLGAVLGCSTVAATRLVGHALELRHRLPRLWERVQAGEVPAWRARRVAEATIHSYPRLTPAAAGWVDSQVAGTAERLGVAQLDRTVAEAVTRFQLACPDPTRDPVDGWQHVDTRHATLTDDAVGLDGTMALEAVLGIADALDLDHALRQGAAAFRALGVEASLDVRRSMALGDLARAQTSLDLTGGDPADRSGGVAGDPADTRAPARPGLPTTHGHRAARQLVLHVHLSTAAIADGQIGLDPLGRLEEGHRLVVTRQVQSWCRDTSTTVTVTPVVDLNAGLESGGYRVPDRIRGQVVLRDRTCVFPWCTRPARACDLDHVTPYDHAAAAEGRPQPGPTCTANLAALCRRHHRLKTHGHWRLRATGPGAFEWTSPHGHRYLRDHTGSRHLPLQPGPERPPQPERQQAADPPTRP